MNLTERARPAPSRRREIEIRDWNRVQRLYAFCRCRAIERIIAAPDDSARQRRDLAILETMYGKARQHNDIVINCAASYFRTQAMRAAHHPDFLGEWI